MADVKTKSIQAGEMPSKRFFDTPALALAALMNDRVTYSDIDTLPIVSPVDSKRGVAGLGADEEGNFVFDSELFPANQRVMISVLTTRNDGEKSSVKGLVIAPVFSTEQIMADEQGRAWLDKIVGTELQRLAVAGLRDRKENGVQVVTDIESAEVLDAMPKTLADYVTSNRVGASTLLAMFEELWKPIKAALNPIPAWKRANLSKREFKFAMSSAAYATQYYPTLEDNAKAKGSVFELAIRGFIGEAEKIGGDTTIFNQWLANRDKTIVTVEEEAEDNEDEFNFETLSAALAPKVEPASE